MSEAKDSTARRADESEEISGEIAIGRAKSLPLAPPREDSVPDLVPARMINEVLYCERLMYLEWVQGEWADNRYTIDGKAVHRRVDAKAQVLKARASGDEEPKEEEERPYSARSVWLSSEKLGITAKIDIVEVDGNRVRPVEYKRGKEPPRGPYLPERAQVAAQVLLLREHGYECEGGDLYFAAERRRVPVEQTADLEATVRRAVARARELSLRGQCPPPLDDDPKCFGCSLSGICLPDEVNVLKDLRDEEEPEEGPNPFDVGDDPWGLAGPEPSPDFDRPVRRLFPARDDKIPLYVRGRGAQLRLVGERIVVTIPGEKATEVRITNTSSVTLLGTVQMTAQAQRRLMEEGIPILFATSGGWVFGRAIGNEPKNVELKSAQFAATRDLATCLRFARSVVKTKILNSRTLLRRNHREPSNVTLGELKQLSRKAEEASSIDSLLGIEGAAARVYFQAFSGMLKADLESTFSFDSRNRRPPRDPVNALLSFCYGLLVRETTMAAHAVGLDPLLGFYHQPRFGRASLALDLMEEFRPIIADSTVLSVINTGVVSPEDFVQGQGAVALKEAARKKVIQAFERRMDQLVTHPVFDYKLSYRRVLETQARLLSRTLLGELPAYPGFRVR
jgi:CRISPR-associated protein Cas1